MLPLFLRSIVARGALGAASATRSGGRALSRTIGGAKRIGGTLFDAAGGNQIPALSNAAGFIGDRANRLGTKIEDVSSNVAERISRVGNGRGSETTQEKKRDAREKAREAKKQHEDSAQKNLDAANLSASDKQTDLLAKMQQDIEVIKDNTLGIGGASGPGDKKEGPGFLKTILGLLGGMSILYLLSKLQKVQEWWSDWKNSDFMEKISTLIGDTIDKAKSLMGAISEKVDLAMKAWKDPSAAASSIVGRSERERKSTNNQVKLANSATGKSLIEKSTFLSSYIERGGVTNTMETFNEVYKPGMSDTEVIAAIDQKNAEKTAKFYQEHKGLTPLSKSPRDINPNPTSLSSLVKRGIKGAARFAFPGVANTMDVFSPIQNKRMEPLSNSYSIPEVLSKETRQADASSSAPVVVTMPAPQPVIVPAQSSGGGSSGHSAGGGTASAPMIVRTQETTLQRLSDAQFSFSVP